AILQSWPRSAPAPARTKRPRRPRAPGRTWPRRRADAAVARARDKSAAPAPLLGVERDARPLADRAGVHVSIIYVQALDGGVGTAAAGESGHELDHSANGPATHRADFCAGGNRNQSRLSRHLRTRFRGGKSSSNPIKQGLAETEGFEPSIELYNPIT